MVSSQTQMGRSALDNQGGFTLLEVAIAVTILTVGLTTLYSIQARQLRNYVNDRGLARSALAAQYVMTMLEVAEDPPKVGTKEGALIDLLKKHRYFEKDTREQQEDVFRSGSYRLTVTSTDLPAIGPAPPQKDVMREVELKIFPDSSSEESYTLRYWMPSS